MNWRSTFAELNLRVGKLQKMLGKEDEALTAIDDAIAKFQASLATNPKTALVGLVMSYNEQGDVLASHAVPRCFNADKRLTSPINRHSSC